MIERVYGYIYKRVECPIEGGYYTELVALPPWTQITIQEDKDSKYLSVQSRVHVNKDVRVGPSYSLDFTDSEIIKDLSGEIERMFL